MPICRKTPISGAMEVSSKPASGQIRTGPQCTCVPQDLEFVANLVAQTVDKKWEVLYIGKSIVSGKYYLLESRECEFVDKKPPGFSGTFPTWVMRKEVEKKNGKWTVGADYMVTKEMTPDGWRRCERLRVIRY